MYCSASVEYFLTELETVRNGNDGKYGLEHVMHDHKVDVFFAGHMHLYERMLPLYQGKVQADKPDPYYDPECPVHVLTGAAGCNYDVPEFPSVTPDYSAKRISDYSFTTVNASSSKLVIQQIAAQVCFGSKFGIALQKEKKPTTHVSCSNGSTYLYLLIEWKCDRQLRDQEIEQVMEHEAADSSFQFLPFLQTRM